MAECMSGGGGTAERQNGRTAERQKGMHTQEF